jgi:hypothetical protein
VEYSRRITIGINKNCYLNEVSGEKKDVFEKKEK